MSNFKEQFLQGKIEFEKVTDFIKKWHESSTSQDIPEYLGLSENEYHLLLRGDGSLKKKLERMKKGKFNAASSINKTNMLNAFRKVIKPEN